MPRAKIPENKLRQFGGGETRRFQSNLPRGLIRRPLDPGYEERLADVCPQLGTSSQAFLETVDGIFRPVNVTGI